MARMRLSVSFLMFISVIFETVGVSLPQLAELT